MGDNKNKRLKNNPFETTTGASLIAEFTGAHKEEGREGDAKTESTSKVMEKKRKEAQNQKTKSGKFGFYLPEDLVDRIKNMAYWERITASEVVQVAVDEYITKHEGDKGEPYPPRAAELKRGKRPQ